jgi:hypothetical protein
VQLASYPLERQPQPPDDAMLMPVVVVQLQSLIDLLQQLMLQLLSLFGSYFSKLILLFSVYIGCFTATAKIIREIVDILIHYNSMRNNAG